MSATGRRRRVGDGIKPRRLPEKAVRPQLWLEGVSDRRRGRRRNEYRNEENRGGTLITLKHAWTFSAEVNI